MTGWRKWSERSQVEWVVLYTRQSLYFLLWGVPGFVLLQLLEEAASAGDRALVAGLFVVLGVAATGLLRAVIELYPAYAPLPVGQMTLLATLSVVALGVIFVADLDTEAQGAGVVLVCWIVVWGFGGIRDRFAIAGVLLAATLIPGLTSWDAGNALFGFGVALFFIFTIRTSLWLLAVVEELDAARSAQAALAVAEERLRFSRDLHDVLGRRLSTIAVQSELAASLSSRGDPRAAERMLDVRAVAHEALRETRELARGYRATDLTQELAGARSLLRSAGIECVVEVDGLPGQWHEPAGWVVREAVTNVLRHSRASRVRIDYASGVLSVANDGAATGNPGHGTGLVGLSERLLPLGSVLEVRREGEEFEVRATMPTGTVWTDPVPAGDPVGDGVEEAGPWLEGSGQEGSGQEGAAPEGSGQEGRGTG